MSGLTIGNARVQRLRRLLGRRRARYDERRFVVEGPVLAAEAVAAGWSCLEQYVPSGASGAAGAAGAVTGAGPVHELAPGVLERVASTEHPRPPLVVVEMPTPDGPDPVRASWALVLDRLRDPGNVGTVLRSAEAAGVPLVVLTPGSADPYNPKVVRASAGALFRVPVATATLDELLAAGFDLVGTTSHEHPGRTVRPYTASDLTGRVGIVVGNEAAGLSADWDDTRGPIRRWITIPHRGRAESLNVAMAATLLAFEGARQRSDDTTEAQG